MEPTQKAPLVEDREEESRGAAGVRLLGYLCGRCVGNSGGKGSQVLLQSSEETLEMFRGGDGVAGRVDALLWLRVEE